MKKAWIENNRVRDVAPGEPTDIYHPDVAVLYDTDIPDDIVPGAELIDGVWTNPPAPIPVPEEPPARRWFASSIRPHLSLAERVKWDNDKTDTIKTAKIELAPGLLEPEATEVLQLLVDAGDISAASMQKILA